jgi:hypothetical protein
MPTADTSSNIIITTYDATAILGTDYGTSGTGLSLAHIPLQKVVWGSDAQAFRVTESTPLPVSILGVTGGSNVIGVTFGAITGSVSVSNRSGTYLVVGGPSGSISGYQSVPVTGHIQGTTNGILLGVTGSVNIANTVTIQGLSGGVAVGITGGRPLSSSRDSVTVTGYVGICGGFGLAAATDSVRVYGSDSGSKVLTKLYASDGATLGHSGDALNVNVIGAGISATVTINPVVGVTNGNGLPLKVIGSGVTSDSPILVKGTIGSGAIDVTATTALPVDVTGTVVIDDADIINSLESTSKPIVSNLASIKTNTSVISTINDRLSAGTITAKITEIIKPTKLYSGYKDLTTTASIIVSTSTPLKSGIHIKAPLTNISTIFVGSSSLSTSSTSGFPLDPGESIFFEIDNLNKVYASSATSGQKINYIAS